VTLGELIPAAGAFEAVRTSEPMVAAMKAIVDQALPIAQASTPTGDPSDSRYTRPGSKREPGTAKKSLRTRAGVGHVEGVGKTAFGRLYSSDFVFRFIEEGVEDRPPHAVIRPAVESVAAGAQVR
jgi:hypothetical protein